MRHDKLQRIIEDKGFYFKHEKEKDGRYSALLEQSTPLGEDWCLEFIYKNIADLVNQIIEYVVRNGVMKDMSVLQESPFTDKGTVADLFGDNINLWSGIREVINTINQNANYA